MLTITINGNSFDNLDTFYDEVQQQLCPDFKSFGRNLDAFNDVLRGGFGLFEYNEPIKLIWANSDKSRKDLGYEAEAAFLKKIRITAHPSNYDSIDKRIEKAKNKQGPTLFDQILRIITGSEHADRIELILD
ncbi:MAG TPA: barstar family protein [Candidatus Saccharimonadales bacterium]|nr:barstar family protein [Candidatus Saccharimonadales bacterium]